MFAKKISVQKGMSRMAGYLKSLVGLDQQNDDTNDVSNDALKTESDVEVVDDGSKYLIPDEDNRESDGVIDLVQFFGSLKLEEKCVTNGHSSGHSEDNLLKPLIDFKVVTQLIDNNVIEIDGKEQIRYDSCNITDLMAGDVVSVKRVDGKVVLKPYRFMVFEGMVTEYQSTSSRFIFARLAFIQKTTSTEEIKVGESLKCIAIQNKSNGFEWRAYPYSEKSNPLVTTDDKTQSFKWLTETIDIEPEKKENLRLVPNIMPRKRQELLKIGEYLIPEKLLDIMKNNQSLDNYIPELNQSLNKNNYEKRLHSLLYIDEYENQKNLKNFEMKKVRFQRNGPFLSIFVPGLSDGRPNLIIGSRVMVINEMTFDGKVFTGTVEEIRRDNILVDFETKFFLSYGTKDTFTVQFDLCRIVYRRCHHAIDMTPKFMSRVLFPRSCQLRPPLISFRAEEPINWFNTKLNVQQKTAVNGILSGECRPTPFIIFGPPGTGKTVTVVEAILQVFARIPNTRIIACTALNSSADLIVELLLKSQLIPEEDLIRISAQHRMNSIPESVQCVTNIADPDYPENWLHHKVIVTTSSQAGVIFKHRISPNHFSHVFVDECAQIIEPETLIPISLCDITNGVVVLAGDHKQLGPVVQSTKAENYGLDCSLMERLMDSFDCYDRKDIFKNSGYYDPKFVVKLINNHRSDGQIMAIPSRLFYNNELKFLNKTDEKLLDSIGLRSPVNFYGVDGADRQEPVSRSWYNTEEAQIVCSYVQTLYSIGVSSEDIGIITPYRKQVIEIQNKMNKNLLKECSIASVNKFQGLEKRIIIISMVRTKSFGFTRNPKLFNVAVSRAKSLLIVVGNPSLLTRDKCWGQFIGYCCGRNSYYGCPFGLKETKEGSKPRRHGKGRNKLRGY